MSSVTLPSGTSISGMFRISPGLISPPIRTGHSFYCFYFLKESSLTWLVKDACTTDQAQARTEKAKNLRFILVSSRFAGPGSF